MSHCTFSPFEQIISRTRSLALSNNQIYSETLHKQNVAHRTFFAKFWPRCFQALSELIKYSSPYTNCPTTTSCSVNCLQTWGKKQMLVPLRWKEHTVSAFRKLKDVWTKLFTHSYKTLLQHSRIEYLQTTSSLHSCSSSPLLLKIQGTYIALQYTVFNALMWMRTIRVKGYLNKLVFLSQSSRHRIVE